MNWMNTWMQERLEEYGQAIFLAAENTSGLGETEKAAIRNMAELSKNGLEKVMREKRLDAIAFPDASASPVLAIGGYPGISAPAGYSTDGLPFGICFGGLRGSEPKLIEITYAFEQATRVRKPPVIISKSSSTKEKILLMENMIRINEVTEVATRCFGNIRMVGEDALCRKLPHAIKASSPFDYVILKAKRCLNHALIRPSSNLILTNAQMKQKAS